MRNKSVLVLGALLAVAAIGYIAFSGPTRSAVGGKAVSGEANTGISSLPLHQVDHATWDGLLSTYTDKDGMVDYAAWHASDADREALSQYLSTLSQADPEAETTKSGKLAFWINAYNALTIHGILEVYPTSSIRNHTARLVGYNIWDDLLLPVGDEEYSLNEIEHEVLRKLGEPRIHFAIVCASIGCPRLVDAAYTPEKLEKQLAMNTRDFFAREQNLQVDFDPRVVRVSSILKWFEEDFGPTPQKALAGLAEYMPNQRTRKLVASEDYSVSYLNYDWSLNQQ